jgi:hypothetical protein
MIATTFAGETVYVLSEVPNWDREVTLQAALPVAAETGLTGRELRTPLARSLRVKLTWAATLSRAEFNTLRNALLAQADARVVCPAWPLAVGGTQFDSGAHVSGGLWIGWEDDWSSFSLALATGFDPDTYDWFAPALLGRLEIEPGQIHRDDCVTVKFTFTEDASADYALAAPAVTWTAGPALNDDTLPKVFPFAVNWSAAPKGALPEVVVTRKTLGRSRLLASAYYPQNPALTTQGEVLVSTPEATAQLLRWWVDCGGSVQPHYLHTHAGTTRLAADAAAGATAITIESAAILGAYRYLALQTPLAVEIARIQSLVGAVATLTAPLAGAWPAALTVVALGALVRHAAPDLEVRFTAPGFGRAQLAWRELAEEYVPAAGETRGESLGAGVETTWLYQFTVDVCGAQTVYRYTSYERDLYAAGQTWLAVPIQHSEIHASLAMDRDEVNLDGRVLAPFLEFLPGRLTGRVLLEISEAQLLT